MEETEYQKQVLQDVFGSSSSSSSSYTSDDDEQQSHQLSVSSPPHCNSTQSYPNPNPNTNPTWKRIDPINGLWLCSDFLSPHQQSSLLSSIQNEGWFTEASNNQAMRFGDLPFWAHELSDQIREVVCAGHKETDTEMLELSTEACVLPSHLLWRKPFFDQLIVNVYQPGEGICAHVDLMRFEDGIAIVSLESPCVMHFSPVEKDDELFPTAMKIPLYLSQGSLIIMSGDARYHWKHEINRKPGCQVWEGQEIQQYRRTSITLRKLCPS